MFTTRPIVIISMKLTEWNWQIYCFHFCVCVCLSVCMSMRIQSSLQQCVSLPQCISHLPHATHLPHTTHFPPPTHLPLQPISVDCKSVWQSVFTRTYRKPHNQASLNFMCMLPVAEARSFSDGIVIYHVLLVLVMTTYFNKTGPVDLNQAWHYL